MLLYFRFIRFDSLGRRGSVLISTQVSRENESKSVSSPKEQFTTGTDIVIYRKPRISCPVLVKVYVVATRTGDSYQENEIKRSSLVVIFSHHGKEQKIQRRQNHVTFFHVVLRGGGIGLLPSNSFVISPPFSLHIQHTVTQPKVTTETKSIPIQSPKIKKEIQERYISLLNFSSRTNQDSRIVERFDANHNLV